LALKVVGSSKYLNEKLLAEVAEEVFSFVGTKFEVGLRFVSRDTIWGLNKQYRHQDKPTNVLSFHESPSGHNGDIVICEEVVEREAADLGYKPSDIRLLYFVHGILHLAGFDHENTVERDKMERAEAEILKKFRVAIER
jgi:probable rRNA maturation factor